LGIIMTVNPCRLVAFDVVFDDSASIAALLSLADSSMSESGVLHIDENGSAEAVTM
jgi:hypothetical protein